MYKNALHSADNKLRIKRLESLSSGSPNTLERSRYNLETERCFAYRGMRKKKSKAVSTVLPTKQNLTTTTIAISRNTNYFSSSSSFISLFFTTNLTGYSRLLGEETSRNHQAYKERPPQHHNIIKNKGCEEVRLNQFSF